MFEVLAFVYETYWRGDACPKRPALQRKLNAVGFDDDEIQDALLWLEELESATGCTPAKLGANAPDHHTTPPHPSVHANSAALRVLTPAEQTRLGREGWGLLAFLVSNGTLPGPRLELVLERAMATPTDELTVDDLKLIVLMVFWRLGEEPDALVLDELCDNREARVGH